MTRCVNCGLPLQPERNQANCPRCGAPLNAFQEVPQQQFEQAGWGNMGGMPQQNPWGQAAAPQQNPWGQVATPTPYNQYPQQNQDWQNGSGMPGFNGGMSGLQDGMGSGMQQTPFTPRRPAPSLKKKPSAALRIAIICFALSVLILGFLGVAALLNGGNSGKTANTGTPQVVATATAPASPTATSASASPTASASPSATGTAYPGQQYITSAQMVANDPTTNPGQQPATSFTVGSNMYVAFNVNPPSQGGAVCSYWYLSGNQVTTYQQLIKAGSKSSYTYAIYGSPGQAYVELYWASDKTCSDKVLAQHVDFTVTAA